MIGRRRKTGMGNPYPVRVRMARALASALAMSGIVLSAFVLTAPVTSTSQLAKSSSSGPRLSNQSTGSGQPSTGSGGTTSITSSGVNQGPVGGGGGQNPPPPPATCNLSGGGCESLLAYNNAGNTSASVPAPGSGQTATLYYEDETPYYGSSGVTPEYPTSSSCVSTQTGPSSSGTSPNPDFTVTGPNDYSDTVAVNAKTLYGASICSLTSTTGEYPAEYGLLKDLVGINPGYAGSTPNASDNNLTGVGGGEGGYLIPYVSSFGFTMPSGLNPGTYTATFHIWDGDGNQDQYSWTFTVSAPPSCSPSTIYNLGDHGTVYALNTSSAVNSAYTSLPSAQLPGSSYAFNGLGMSSTEFYAVAQGGNSTTTNVIVDNPTTGDVSTYSVPAGNDSSDLVAGGVDPANGNYYYAEYSAGTSIDLFEFNTTLDTGAQIGTISLAHIGLGVSTHKYTFGNGDLAFDEAGNMYFLAGSEPNNGVYPPSGIITVTAAQIASASAAASSSTSLIASLLSTLTGGPNAQFVGVAFVSTGNLYAETYGGGLYSIDANTGAVTPVGNGESGTNGNGVVDLASCEEPGSITVVKNLPDGRVNSSDQFTVSVSGTGISGTASGTTSGDSSGLQTEAGAEAGPVIGIAGDIYKISEVAANSTTNMSDYSSSWACTDTADSSFDPSGTGTSGSFTFPQPSSTGDGGSVECIFTNKATPPAPTLSIVKDQSLGGSTSATTPITFTPTGTGTTTGSYTLTPSASGVLGIGDSITVKDVLPTNASLTYTGYTDTGAASALGESCTPSTLSGTSGTILCTFTNSGSTVYTLTSSSLGTITINFTLANDAAPGTISNTATMASGTSTGTSNTVTITIGSPAAPTLSIVKDQSLGGSTSATTPITFTPTGTGTTTGSYTLTPSASGVLGIGDSITVKDVLPTNASLTYTGYTDTGATGLTESCTPSTLSGTSGTILCTFTNSGSTVYTLTSSSLGTITINFTLANDAAPGTISNTATMASGTSTGISNTVTIAVVPPVVTAPSTTTVVPPTAPKPVTSPSSTVVVPATHTGEPWAGSLWWILFGGLGALGGAIVTDGYRRRRRTA